MFKRIVQGVRGFTLIELLAVMAIVATLAGIVSVAVSGTGSTSRDTQVLEDGNSAGSSLANYFDDQPVTEVLSTKAVTVLGFAVDQETSNQFPEEFITVTYATAFESPSVTNVEGITLLGSDGNGQFTADDVASTAVIAAVSVSGDGVTWTVTKDDGTSTDVTASAPVADLTVGGAVLTFTVTVASSGTAAIATVTVTSGGADAGVLTHFTVDDLLDKFAVLDFDVLSDGGYVTTIPISFKSVSTVSNIDFHNYLWLLEEDTVLGSTGDVPSRNIAVYVLASVEDAETDGDFDLTYQRIV